MPSPWALPGRGLLKCKLRVPSAPPSVTNPWQSGTNTDWLEFV